MQEKGARMEKVFSIQFLPPAPFKGGVGSIQQVSFNPTVDKLETLKAISLWLPIIIPPLEGAGGGLKRKKPIIKI